MNALVIILPIVLAAWLVFGLISSHLNKQVRRGTVVSQDTLDKARQMEAKQERLYAELRQCDAFSPEYFELCKDIKTHDEKFMELMKGLE